jgi:hypothetical protein
MFLSYIFEKLSTMDEIAKTKRNLTVPPASATKPQKH